MNATINKTFNAPFNLIKDPLSAGLSFGGSFVNTLAQIQLSTLIQQGMITQYDSVLP